jgi:hypothetical protein
VFFEHARGTKQREPTQFPSGLFRCGRLKRTPNDLWCSRAFSGSKCTKHPVTHSGILTAYAIVAQSLGLDARRSEGFYFAHKISLDENGQVLRGDDARPLDDVRKELNYARERSGNVLISGAATQDIPLQLTKKQLSEAQYFDDHSIGFDAANAIRAVSTGVYELKHRRTPRAMVRLKLCDDEDARGPDTFALASGFIVLA